ncbi:MAG TPA: family 43 glycosylhydrolase, partial [Cellvibrionaceae bacterium]|nr:family 43 glycosylhydrolase [Cellvibrionaceae bacterium]
MKVYLKNSVALLALPALLTSLSCTQPIKPMASAEKNSLNTAPTEFDNPIIKYDTPDPTRQVGAIIYTADPVALVVDDWVYLYTGHDEQTQSGVDYRMYDYRLWASQDLMHWQNKGAVLRYSDFAWARGSEKTGNAYAGHVTHRKGADGKANYYFYTTLEGGQKDFGFAIGVAVSDKPEGPFVDPRGMPMILLSDTAQYQKHSWRNIDPAVFIDDDGRAYLY